MERKFNSKTQKDFKGGNRKSYSNNKSGVKKPAPIKKAKFLIGPMLPSKTGVLASVLLKRYKDNGYIETADFFATNKEILDKVLENAKVNFNLKLLGLLSAEKNATIRENYYKNVFYNLTAIVLTKEFDQLKKWGPIYLENIKNIAKLFERNENTKPLYERIMKFHDCASNIIAKGKVEGSDKEAIKEVMNTINVDGIKTDEVGYILKDLVEKFDHYMKNTLRFTSVHIGFNKFMNCVIFFDEKIDDVLMTALPTDFRKILFASMYNFKLFNTDNIAIINKNILDCMLEEGENEYDKLFDPALTKKVVPVKKKPSFNKKFDNKKSFGGGKKKWEHGKA